ncbi:Centromere protein Cenp-O [Niveomyces insectorum RCEF 264]|uniref:Centromere protein Cenp-O n=1 Tax=Niveomyces insectorum RCEF 264 TaxID=1081102 RepID=A0A167UIN4_9HYPO|nr:Centromere protein Cenp-O [Niveomyces insectorum RCEF 264]
MASQLDDEIEQLRDRAATLQKQLQVQISSLLSTDSVQQLLREDSYDDGVSADSKKRLNDLCASYATHKQQSLYRAGSSITAFRVRDPDPNAVDGGRVLGLRLDIMMGAQFLRPYYVLLNRDVNQRRTRSRPQQDGTSKASGPLRVHRHTVPPSIPLAGLATRYLGTPSRISSSSSSSSSPSQAASPDLYGFARALRRALVGYHNRLAVIGDLRRAVQQQTSANAAAESTSGDADSVQNSKALVDVSGADAEAKQIRLDWTDGRTGRLILDDDGDIQNLVVIGTAGVRDRVAARELLAGETTAMGLVRRLNSNV